MLIYTLAAVWLLPVLYKAYRQAWPKRRSWQL